MLDLSALTFQVHLDSSSTATLFGDAAQPGHILSRGRKEGSGHCRACDLLIFGQTIPRRKTLKKPSYKAFTYRAGWQVASTFPMTPPHGKTA